MYIPMSDEIVDPIEDHTKFSEQEWGEWHLQPKISGAIEVPDFSEDSINMPDIDNIKGSGYMSWVDSEGLLSFV